MEPQEVPPFVYQLLFLCYQSDHLVPLQHLAKYFDYKLRRCGQIANLSSSRGNSMDIECEIGSVVLKYLYLFISKLGIN